jgi:hypothetical protein
MSRGLEQPSSHFRSGLVGFGCDSPQRKPADQSSAARPLRLAQSSTEGELPGWYSRPV